MIGVQLLMELNDKARMLRRKGKSFREVARELNIAVSTAHLWAKNVELSLKQKESLKQKSLIALQISRKKAQRLKKNKYTKEVERNLEIGIKMVGEKMSKREYLLIGASLYWAEGFKRDNRLGFANSDPTMIKLILFWLTEILNIDRDDIRLSVGININFKDNVEEIEKYWSDITGISLNQFNKPFFQKTTLKRNYSNRGEYHGVLRIRAIGQNGNFRKILGMVEGLRNVEQKVK